MGFLGGPRQVGKTTLALSLLGKAGESHPAYFNWDVPGVQKRLLLGELPANEPLIILERSAIAKVERIKRLFALIYFTLLERVNHSAGKRDKSLTVSLKN